MANPKVNMHVEGLSDLLDNLLELPKATGRNVLRRVATKALEPMERTAEALAPHLSGELRDSIKVSTNLSKRQKSQHNRDIGAKTVVTSEGYRSTAKTAVFVFMGPQGSPKSIVQEFGSVDQAPHPYMRPAWDGNKERSLDIVKEELGDEIEKAAARLARKAAKLK